MRVVVAPTRVANFPLGGGHFWAYMQHVLGLVQHGCEVYWLEKLEPTQDPSHNVRLVNLLRKRLAQFGLEDRLLVYVDVGPTPRFVNVWQKHAESVCRSADLLVNFRYDTRRQILDLFQRTALVDIDPGLLQLWMHEGHIEVAEHDAYFTIGETIGKRGSSLPTCGLPWMQIRPAVCLDQWPVVATDPSAPFTTVSGWSGEEWLQDGRSLFENTKRVSFLRFLDLPRRTRCSLELALDLGPGNPDTSDRETLHTHGWSVRTSRDVAASPDEYRRYIQFSAGEFGVAKPIHVLHQTAWVSDRTLCYLASGKPAVVQDTGPSDVLPQGEGLFRVHSVDEAAAALSVIRQDYPRQSAAARDIARTLFDARKVASFIVDASFSTIERFGT